MAYDVHWWLDVLRYVLLGMLVLPFVFFIWFIIKHKYYITVRVLTGGKKIVYRDRARIVKDKKGVKKLKLWKQKDRIPFPPDHVCEVTNRGKIAADVYKTQEGQYIWCNDPGLNNGILIPEGRHAHEFEALNTIDRDFYAGEYEEAEKYKRTGILSFLAQQAPLIGIIIMVVLLFIYFEDIVQPLKEMQKENIKAMEIQNRLLEQTSRILAQTGQTPQVITDGGQLNSNNTGT